ncbi:MAG: glycosyltransferase family 2 protein [Lachnospiraceae bacterium]|nr:glycosyltransferase family 2 protein [Lachnospiraceae bacterium]
MKYYIDQVDIKEGVITVNGWAVPENVTHRLKVELTNKDGSPLEDGSIVLIERPDVVAAMAEGASDNRLGFHAEFSVAGTIRMSDAQDETDTVSKTITSADAYVRAFNTQARDNLNAFKAFLKSDNKKQAFKQTKFFIETQYAHFYKKQSADEKTLNSQRNTALGYSPLISIIVPVYNPKPEHIKAMIASVKAQTYGNWQLCLANGTGTDEQLSRMLSAYAKKDSRIVNARLRDNRGISGNTNVALKIATGEWIALMDQDDYIAPNALFEYVSAMNENSEIDAIYCDEDKLDDDTGKHYDPNFKPDFNIDLLTCNNYICHMFMVRKSIVDQVGPFNSEYDGAQDHDFILRCTDVARKTHHIPKMLYSWRSHRASTAAAGASKTYAFDAGVKAIQAYYDRKGIPGCVSRADYLGWYRTDFHIDNEPLISVIIPNKDHVDDLERCVSSLLERITYKNYEIIVVENNSENAETFEYYRTLEQRSDKIRVVTWEREFNYSAINNFGATFAKGEYLLLLNNDTEVISPDLFTSMMGYCMRDDVGAVGPKLLYADDTVQHAGVLIGVEHAAHHVFLHYGADDMGYLGRAIVSQDMSGVTAACMLIKRSVWDKVGGLDEEFVVAYNDVDLCLKIGSAGYLVVYDAFVRMHHYESKSRGSDLSDKNKERFESEKARLLEKWGSRMDSDPYYNVNLTSLRNGYYRL